MGAWWQQLPDQQALAFTVEELRWEHGMCVSVACGVPFIFICSLYDAAWEVGTLTFLNGSLGVNTPDLSTFMGLHCPCVLGWHPFQHMKLNQTCYPGGCTVQVMSGSVAKGCCHLWGAVAHHPKGPCDVM